MTIDLTQSMIGKSKIGIVTFSMVLSTMDFNVRYHTARLTKANRICFNEYPALFNGMKPERIGQFHYEEHGELYMCRMVTTTDRFHHDRSRFLAQCLRARTRLTRNKKIVQQTLVRVAQVTLNKDTKIATLELADPALLQDGMSLYILKDTHEID